MMQTIVIGIPFSVGLASASRSTESAAIVATMPPMASRRVMCALAGFVGFIRRSMLVVSRGYFVYHQSMDVEDHADHAVSGIAAATAEPHPAPLPSSLCVGP